MRLPINLASEPFRRDRPILVASAAVAGLLLASFTMFAYLALSERNRAAEARDGIAATTRQLETMSAEQSKLNSILRRPENAAVLDRSQFVNSLLLRKGVSWTRIFADLETVVPHNVRVIQIRPHLVADNQVVLEMMVGAQASESVINLLMKLESSPQFGATTVHNWLPPSQTEPLYRYRVSVNYAQKL